MALGAFGGRLDHILGNLNALHLYPDHRIVLVGDGNATRLLPIGTNNILLDQEYEGPTCGIIPIAGKAISSFQGLRWNIGG